MNKNTNTIKVLFVTHVAGMAGANRSMFQLIKELKEDYNVFSAVLGPPCDPDKITIKKKLDEIHVEYIETRVVFFKQHKPTIKSFFRYLRFLHSQRFLYKKLKPYKFDIVHSNSGVIDLGAYISKQLKSKHIWHLRDFGDKDYSLYPVGGKLYEKYTYRHADAFIAISKAIQDHYQRIINPQKIHLIYNGIEEVEDRFIAKHQNKQIEFLCAGIITSGKNQMEIVKAADELINKRNITKFHVTLVGFQDEEYVCSIIKTINNNNLNNYFTILKETDGIKELASTMDVGIMCSNTEAFGRVTVEYMLQNLIVIANNHGANPEIINNGRTGYLYTANSYISLADKMQNIIEMPKFPTEISKSGMLSAKSHFLSIHNTNNIFQLYCSLLTN